MTGTYLTTLLVDLEAVSVSRIFGGKRHARTIIMLKSAKIVKKKGSLLITS